MTNNTQTEILHKTALLAPSSSGVYLWKNSSDTVIYVGKAKNLKNRLTSYFTKGKDLKTHLLVSNAHSIEYITTSNEYEAFLLENTLIKKYNPRYNINLKDGKSYPVLRITNEEFPRVFKTRNILQDGSTYFGPYPDAGTLDTFINTLYEIYPIRHCKILRKKETPCMYYHIGLCHAPCCKKITAQSYNEFIGEIKALLENKKNTTIQKIKKEMENASQNLNFEKAARLRDGLNALKILKEQNIVETFDGNDADYIAWQKENELVSFVVLKFRNGKMQGQDIFRTISLNETDELTEEFFSAYYEKLESAPPHIYLKQNSTTFLSLQEIEHWFLEKLKSKTKIIFVSDKTKKHHTAIIKMAVLNAKEDIERRKREINDEDALQELKTLLKLKNLPIRIEGFDIAHLAGKFPVASLISFKNGNPDKKNYRYFRLKTTDGIIDDFTSMKEATTRRYTRLLNEEKDLPDLILIDGGIGQVNAVFEVLTSLKLDIPIVGLAKKNEELYLPGNSTPLIVPKSSSALRLLQRVRDETHRFATTQNQKLRTKENTENVFLQIAGIGSKRSNILKKEFTTLENLCKESEEKIAFLLNINTEKAKKILESAKKLYEKNNQKKEAIFSSLQVSGTTPQNAQKAHAIQNLAEEALE
ncbi:MAG: excinuclease ABC subunit UvrC [Treponema sp.]|nr:excinuclease ABC subunit UvrC [Treponema sp.]